MRSNSITKLNTTNNLRSKTQSTERNNFPLKTSKLTNSLRSSKLNINQNNLAKEPVSKNPPAQVAKSKKENMNVNKDILVKKKHSTIKIKDNTEKSNLTSLKSKIDELYRKLNSNDGNNSAWKKSFQDLFEKEKIIDFSSDTFKPKSLDKIGSTILRLDKVWVLWMEIIKNEINLPKLVDLANEALNYLSDDKLIRIRFNSIVNYLKVSKKEIKDYASYKNININNKHIGEHDFLLDKNACQSIKNNLSTNNNLNFISSSKTKKLSNKPENSLQFKIDSIKKILLDKDEKNLEIEKNDKMEVLQNQLSNCNSNNDHDIQVKPIFLENYEASYMTINESLNEDTINNTSKMNTTDKIEKGESEKKNNSIRIMTPEVCTQVANEDCIVTLIENNLFTLAKEPNLLPIDTKSIVDDIENLTMTLKKDVEQLSAFKQEDLKFKTEKIENCLLSDECECQLHNRKKSISPILLRKSCAPQINFDYENVINQNETENTLNNINEGNEEVVNSVKIDVDSKEDIYIKEASQVFKENTPEKEPEKPVEREDSYEKYLRQIAEKRGDNLEEFISYNNIVPIDVNCIDDKEENSEQNSNNEDENINQTDGQILNSDYDLDEEVNNLRKRLTENRNNRQRSKNKKRRKTKSKKRTNK